MRRLALPALLSLALLLIPAPGASAATCTAGASGPWSASGTWSCHAVPGGSDAVVIPAGKTVSVGDGSNPGAASVTLKGGTLALGDSSELDTGNFAAIGGGTISGPHYALLTVQLDDGVQATVDAGGLTVDGAYLNLTGTGTFGVAGPLALTDGGWVESDVDTTWSGTTPWQIGGGAGTPPDPPPTSGFEMVGGQLTITGATAAQAAASGGDGAIQLDGGATLYKQDATTTTLGLGVLLDTSEIHVVAGKLIGRFQGSGELNVSTGATLGLAGSGVQLAPPAIDLTGGTIEVEAGANVSLALPSAPALRHLGLLAGAALDVSIDNGSGPVDSAAAPDDLAKEIAIGSGATLSIDGGGGILGLSVGETLSGGGVLDGSLANDAGAVEPNGALHLTGDYSQAAGGTLALDLRSASDGDSLKVDGSVSLAGTLRVATNYAPAASAAPLVIAATSKPAGGFTKTVAPISATHGWVPAYGPAGVTLTVGAPSGDGGDGPADLSAPSLHPSVPIVGGRTRCDPGNWKGAHALAYQWLRGSKPIAKATAARYLVAAGDGGQRLSCRVTATATDGIRSIATSNRARARLGLVVVGVSVDAGGVSVTLRCARSERHCSGSVRVLVAGHPVARGHFALRSPGGVVQLGLVAGARRPASGELATVLVAYRNRAGAARTVLQRLVIRD
ncbi:MAG: hypothetical protein M3Q31_20730 [Actinomycetota bacterium]|nr:hypothetical protein [Actinomycetota bacterium]